MSASAAKRRKLRAKVLITEESLSSDSEPELEIAGAVETAFVPACVGARGARRVAAGAGAAAEAEAAAAAAGAETGATVAAKAAEAEGRGRRSQNSATNPRCMKCRGCD